MVGKVNEVGRILEHPKDLTRKYPYDALLNRVQPQKPTKTPTPTPPPKNITPGKGGIFDATA